MYNDQQIYTLNNRCVLGKLGAKTSRVQQPKCSKCNRTLPEEIDFLEIEYVFDEYNGEDLFSAENALIATVDLYNALLNNNIKGIIPIRVLNSTSKIFAKKKLELPGFVHLAVIPSSVENIPIAYDLQDKCDECKLYIMKFDINRYKLNFRQETENQSNLKVHSDSWNGNDIFNFRYHGEIGVTQKFLDVIKDFNCPENIIIPAEWIDGVGTIIE